MAPGDPTRAMLGGSGSPQAVPKEGAARQRALRHAAASAASSPQPAPFQLLVTRSPITRD